MINKTMNVITKEIWLELMNKYSAFHDATFESIILSDFKNFGLFSLNINLIAYNTNLDKWSKFSFRKYKF